MTKEELFFKENYPEYVTEKGECLSPYWDLFSAGVICATFELNNKIAELKAYNEKLLDGDIEKHNKIVEMGKENSRLKQIILGNEMEIAAKDETIEELKKEVQGYQEFSYQHIVGLTDVIAWKEIVLPKEIKENDL